MAWSVGQAEGPSGERDRLASSLRGRQPPASNEDVLSWISLCVLALPVECHWRALGVRIGPNGCLQPCSVEGWSDENMQSGFKFDEPKQNQKS